MPGATSRAIFAVTRTGSDEPRCGLGKATGPRECAPDDKLRVPINYPRQGMVGTAQLRLSAPYENVAATLPSPDNSITTLSPALSQMVLTRLPVSTISPARSALPSEAR